MGVPHVRPEQWSIRLHWQRRRWDPRIHWLWTQSRTTLRTNVMQYIVYPKSTETFLRFSVCTTAWHERFWCYSITSTWDDDETSLNRWRRMNWPSSWRYTIIIQSYTYFLDAAVGESSLVRFLSFVDRNLDRYPIASVKIPSYSLDPRVKMCRSGR